jgi:hypothetical protein
VKTKLYGYFSDYCKGQIQQSRTSGKLRTFSQEEFWFWTLSTFTKFVTSSSCNAIIILSVYLTQRIYFYMSLICNHDNSIMKLVAKYCNDILSLFNSYKYNSLAHVIIISLFYFCHGNVIRHICISIRILTSNFELWTWTFINFTHYTIKNKDTLCNGQNSINFRVGLTTWLQELYYDRLTVDHILSLQQFFRLLLWVYCYVLSLCKVSGSDRMAYIIRQRGNRPCCYY